MGRISRENIEEFILDYLEGNLDSNTHGEVKTFLLLNPDIEERLCGTDLAYLNPIDIKYPNKPELKASESYHEFEDKCILSIENLLEPHLRENLTEEIASSKTKMEIMNYYKSTIFCPDKSIVFENKNSLKHTISLKFRRKLYFQAVAAIILLISVSSLIMKKQDLNDKNIIDYYIPVASEIKQDIIIEIQKQEPADNIKIKTSKSNIPVLKNNIVTPKKSISKIPIIDIIPNSEKLLACSVFNSPEPNEIIIPDESYSMADRREFCLNSKAMQWTDNNIREKGKNNQNINTLIVIGETTLKTLFSRFVNTTRISHEKVIYVAESKMD